MAGYSETMMEYAQSPVNRGRFEHPDCTGALGQIGRGRYLQLQLLLDGPRIASARFECHGCGVTVATGSALTEMVSGLTHAQASALEPADLAAALDGLPPHKSHCADFAVQVLKLTLADWEVRDGA